jgi:hypothetical protein
MARGGLCWSCVDVIVRSQHAVAVLVQRGAMKVGGCWTARDGGSGWAVSRPYFVKVAIWWGLTVMIVVVNDGGQESN